MTDADVSSDSSGELDPLFVPSISIQWRPIPRPPVTATVPSNSSQRRSSVPCGGDSDADDLISGEYFNSDTGELLWPCSLVAITPTVLQ